jgi:dienelactone hydrolase
MTPRSEEMNNDSDLKAALQFEVSTPVGSQVRYSVNEHEYQGFYISPSDKAPLVMIIHDWHGLDTSEMKRAQMLALEGFAAFAIDMYGIGVRPETIEEKRAQVDSLYQDREKMRALVSGALSKATSLGANTNNMVMAGYCFGGAVALEMARAGFDARGFVTFHGNLATPEHQDYSKTKGALLIQHGAADTVVTLDQFVALAKEFEKEGVKNEMTTYGGAPHAFTIVGGPNYHEQADKKSWRRFIQFLKEVTGS